MVDFDAAAQDDTSSVTQPDEPLGLQSPLLPTPPLGQSMLQRSFLVPLGARSLTILDPSIFLRGAVEESPANLFEETAFFPTQEITPANSTTNNSTIQRTPQTNQARSAQSSLASERIEPSGASVIVQSDTSPLQASPLISDAVISDGEAAIASNLQSETNLEPPLAASRSNPHEQTVSAVKSQPAIRETLTTLGGQSDLNQEPVNAAVAPAVTYLADCSIAPSEISAVPIADSSTPATAAPSQAELLNPKLLNSESSVAAPLVQALFATENRLNLNETGADRPQLQLSEMIASPSSESVKSIAATETATAPIQQLVEVTVQPFRSHNTNTKQTFDAAESVDLAQSSMEMSATAESSSLDVTPPLSELTIPEPTLSKSALPDLVPEAAISTSELDRQAQFSNHDKQIAANKSSPATSLNSLLNRSVETYEPSSMNSVQATPAGESFEDLEFGNNNTDTIAEQTSSLSDQSLNAAKPAIATELENPSNSPALISFKSEIQAGIGAEAARNNSSTVASVPESTLTISDNVILQSQEITTNSQANQLPELRSAIGDRDLNLSPDSAIENLTSTSVELPEISIPTITHSERSLSEPISTDSAVVAVQLMSQFEVPTEQEALREDAIEIPTSNNSSNHLLDNSISDNIAQTLNSGTVESLTLLQAQQNAIQPPQQGSKLASEVAASISSANFKTLPEAAIAPSISLLESEVVLDDAIAPMQRQPPTTKISEVGSPEPLSLITPVPDETSSDLAIEMSDAPPIEQSNYDDVQGVASIVDIIEQLGNSSVQRVDQQITTDGATNSRIGSDSVYQVDSEGLISAPNALELVSPPDAPKPAAEQATEFESPTIAQLTNNSIASSKSDLAIGSSKFDSSAIVVSPNASFIQRSSDVAVANSVPSPSLLGDSTSSAIASSEGLTSANYSTYQTTEVLTQADLLSPLETPPFQPENAQNLSAQISQPTTTALKAIQEVPPKASDAATDTLGTWNRFELDMPISQHSSSATLSGVNTAPSEVILPRLAERSNLENLEVTQCDRAGEQTLELSTFPKINSTTGPVVNIESASADLISGLQQVNLETSILDTESSRSEIASVAPQTASSKSPTFKPEVIQAKLEAIHSPAISDQLLGSTIAPTLEPGGELIVQSNVTDSTTSTQPSILDADQVFPAIAPSSANLLQPPTTQNLEGFQPIQNHPNLRIISRSLLPSDDVKIANTEAIVAQLNGVEAITPESISTVESQAIQTLGLNRDLVNNLHETCC